MSEFKFSQEKYDNLPQEIRDQIAADMSAAYGELSDEDLEQITGGKTEAETVFLKKVCRPVPGKVLPSYCKLVSE